MATFYKRIQVGWICGSIVLVSKQLQAPKEQRNSGLVKSHCENNVFFFNSISRKPTLRTSKIEGIALYIFISNSFFLFMSLMLGVNHLIELIAQTKPSFLMCLHMIRSTDLYIDSGNLAVTPKVSKQMFQCRRLCFLRSLVEPLASLLHFIARL